MMPGIRVGVRLVIAILVALNSLGGPGTTAQEATTQPHADPNYHPGQVPFGTFIYAIGMAVAGVLLICYICIKVA